MTINFNFLKDGFIFQGRGGKGTEGRKQSKHVFLTKANHRLQINKVSYTDQHKVHINKKLIIII